MGIELYHIERGIQNKWKHCPNCGADAVDIKLLLFDKAMPYCENLDMGMEVGLYCRSCNSDGVEYYDLKLTLTDGSNADQSATGHKTKQLATDAKLVYADGDGITPLLKK